MDKSKDEMNPYMALRAEKIARNETRLKQLGLLKPTPTSSKRRQTNSQATKPSRKRFLNSSTAAHPETDTGILRRSSRLSLKDGTDNPSDVGNEIRQFEGRKRQRKRQAPNEGADRKRIPVPSMAPTIAANSVRALSLSAPAIVEKFLGKYMDDTGKEAVINQAFQEAACSKEELQRMEGVRLSFNKYCGVQLWRNGAFLWVNMGGDSSPNAIVNEFLDEGRLVTWFGGSRMYEDSPVIQELFKFGKQATKSHDSGIILWCRAYDAATKKFSPYCSLGRLVYHSHIEGSYPVAFTWKLLDYPMLMASRTSKELFQKIIHS